METHDLIQGSENWHAHRAAHRNASDAPAMMSCSPYKTRDQLLHEMHTGITQEFDGATLARMKDGHRVEALARPLAEAIIGDELYPVTGSNGKYSASFDGLTMMEDPGFEHKALNDALRAAFDDMETIAPDYRGSAASRSLPLLYRVQMEQQCMVADCKRILFMASKWGGDTLIEERHCWYEADPALRAEIVAGWEQFDKDLAAYTPTEAKAAPVAAPVQSLPAVSVRLNGALAVVSNLAEVSTAVHAFIAGMVPKPRTDQQFADAEAECKALKRGEDALEVAENAALAELTDVDAMRRTVADLRALMRSTRLAREKIVEAEKTNRRGEIVAGGMTALKAHIAGLNSRLGKLYMPALPLEFTDFGGAIKGKKNLDSMQSTVNDLLARAKIKANEVADAIDANAKYLVENATGYERLFLDTASIVLKAPDDLAALVANRISAEKARQEAENKRILDAEREKMEREAREKVEREQREEAARQAAATPAPAPAPTPAPAPIAQPASVTPAPQPVANVVQMRAPDLGPAQHMPARAAEAEAQDGWQPSRTLPKMPDQWIQVQEVALYRFLPYKPNSTEAKRGIKGRWQRHNGYGFENAEPPNGTWRIGEEVSAAA